MVAPILATKLHTPLPRPNLVLRPRLIERLNEGLDRKLTLISASAGFGKTTVVSAWMAGCKRPGAWLSLDVGDRDLSRFLTYLIAALQTIAPSMGAEVSGLLQSPQPPPADSILTVLLNEIAATIPDHFILVLDDYHLIEANPIDQAVTFLLERLPPHMHVVIVTREDPNLPLARLRARAHLIELRAADLRFTLAEAAEFLSSVMGLNLSAADIATLEKRTEGWIAGLQLAALSLQGRQDASRFIQAFAGDHRYVADYLVEEVLQRQPEPVRNFLLQTAILDQLCGPLCDAVTGQQDGQARLEALERGAFFVVPLDDKRHWYRYHHLFADVLSARLQTERLDEVTALHRRASAWYERHGLTAEAIHHALAAEDFERAADLIEMALAAMHRSKQEATLLGWLYLLPDELIHRRPVLSVGYAWAFLASGDLDAAEARLRDAEQGMQKAAEQLTVGKQAPAAATEKVYASEAEFRRLPASIAVYRAAHAQAMGDVSSAVKYARRALDLVPEDDQLGRGAATALLGLASWASGDLETAYQTFADGMARVQFAGAISDAITGAIALAEIRIAQGRLHDAMRIYERYLQLATEQGEPVLRGTADLYVGMSELYCERNDLYAAVQRLLKSKEFGEQNGLAQNRYRWRVAMAHIREAQRDLGGALDLLLEAQRLYMRDFFPTVRPVAALVTRVWVAQGRVDEAIGWARAEGLSVDDDLTYLREFEHITLARVFLSQYTRDRGDDHLREAMGLLDRLLRVADAGGRTGNVIEILALQALSHQAQGDIPTALIPLESALTLAEPEDYVRTFVNEGPAMMTLLREAAARGVTPEYAGRLLAAYGAESQISADEARLPHSSVARAMIEPLTQRELDVLRLFKTELSGPEIADQLVVALSTLRTHTKSIYRKLNVTNRRAAVKQATALNLL
jgi:LuxR family maltose regulon positive regulatory protein